MSNKEKFEREFESFLHEEDSQLAALYRKLPRPEPDAKLDAAVLAMARRAAATAPRMRARAPRWIPALSAAAVVALAAGIAFRIGPQVWQERAAPVVQKPAAENDAAPAPAAANIDAKKQPADTDGLKDKAASRPSPATIPESRAMPVQPAAPPAVAPSAARREKSAEHVPLEKLEAAKRADAPAPQAFPQTAPEQKTAQPAAGNAAQAETSNEFRDKDMERTRGTMQAAPTAEPMATATAPAHEEPEPSPAQSKPFAAQTAGSAAADAAHAAPAPALKAGRMAPLRSNDPNASLYPEHWLANIRVMLRENKHDEALRSLAEFRRMYPQYHLPDDLRDLRTPE